MNTIDEGRAHDVEGVLERLHEHAPLAEDRTLLSDSASLIRQLDKIVTRFLQAHDEGTGLIDSMDNDGERYTSQFLDETIRTARAVKGGRDAV